MSLLRRTLASLKAAAPDPLAPAVIEIAGQPITISFKRNARARRIVLRLGRGAGEVSVTLPKRVSRTAALDFVHRSQGWIETRLSARPAQIAFAPGSSIPYRGVPHAVVADPGRRGLVRADAETCTLTVPGDPAHLSRRLTDWLKAEARRELGAASARYAAAMAVRYRRIVIRDQKSRWGSCSSSGDIAYSWRLILAPPEVLDYVAAHEVAHLQHMDHSARFWRLVLSHCPAARTAKGWLKQHSGDVHRYG